MDTGKQKKIDAFNENNPGASDGNLFGLPFNFEESETIVLPVPWEVTVSYSPGTAKGPLAIREASLQVDLYDHDLANAWHHGIYMLGLSEDWRQRNKQLRARASEHIRMLEAGDPAGLPEVVKQVNEGYDALRKWIFDQSKMLLEKGKRVVLLGGDHSTPLGYVQALAQQYPSFGILQIDAHADLRKAYEGFTGSHASIMYNILQVPQVTSLVQVGLRDVCAEEMELIRQEPRVHAFFDHDLADALFKGKTWHQLAENIVEKLPEQVYLSIDIDGFDPSLCPNTGTPVPGGLVLEQFYYLLRLIVSSGRRIIGFDLVEVAPGEDEWDANVGARLLYKTINLMTKSNRST